jgi:DNA-binding response OmpR family regulator
MEGEARILMVEGRHNSGPAFIPGLRKKGFNVQVVDTGGKAAAAIAQFRPHVVVVNSPSLRSSGKNICHSIHKSNNKLPVLLITDLEKQQTSGFDADVIIRLPFTSRKLINRINPLLPGESDQILLAGPIKLDLEKRRVVCRKQEANLTPRLTELLKTLMEKHNEVIERGYLFSQVWETEFTGDTRTLDVHISWLRKALEKDPRHPEFLKTIRGVGYRLDING